MGVECRGRPEHAVKFNYSERPMIDVPSVKMLPARCSASQYVPGAGTPFLFDLKVRIGKCEPGRFDILEKGVADEEANYVPMLRTQSAAILEIAKQNSVDFFWVSISNKTSSPILLIF